MKPTDPRKKLFNAILRTEIALPDLKKPMLAIIELYQDDAKENNDYEKGLTLQEAKRTIEKLK